MKRILRNIYLLLGLCAIVGTTSCDKFLTIDPEDTFTKDNYWTSEANVKLYAWKFYDLFLGYGNGTGTSSEFYFQNSPTAGCINISDDLANATFLKYNTTSVTTSSEWNNYYNQIRAANVMLEKLPTVPMSSEAAKHWEGVARFFRAYCYFALVQRYGDVPYIDKAASYTDDAGIYIPRTARATVMAKVIEDLTFASENMRVNDGATSINKYAAYALLSRVALFEGTYVKYHGIGNGAEYLTVAKNAADAIITSAKYTIGSDFKAVYNSIDLSSGSAKGEVIFYKKYLPAVLMHSIQSYTNTSSAINGLTKVAAESYVCSDGLPINQSSKYKGDNSLNDVLTERDKRMSAVVDAQGYGYADKTLGGLTSSTGYIICLYNSWIPPVKPVTENTTNGQNHIDAPVYTYAEVLLNYAEACAELGTCTQADLDKSINKLRTRAGLPNLTILGSDVTVNGVVINDPKRTSTLEPISGIVSPLLWEIRRERRSELMTWTFIRYYDLMRWNKGEYLDSSKNPDVMLGAKLVGVTLKNTKVNADGYILPYTSSSVRTFESPKNYLNSIPLSEITLYATEGVELTQNPGWNK